MARNGCGGSKTLEPMKIVRPSFEWRCNDSAPVVAVLVVVLLCNRHRRSGSFDATHRPAVATRKPAQPSTHTIELMHIMFASVYHSLRAAAGRCGAHDECHQRTNKRITTKERRVNTKQQPTPQALAWKKNAHTHYSALANIK